MNKEEYILVTGATSGIGASIVKSLSKNYNVIVHGRNAEKINLVIERCEHSNKQLAFIADLLKYEDIELQLATFVKEQNILITAFVHSAGYMSMLPAKMTSIDIISKTFSTNVFSAAMIVKTLLKRNVNSDALKNIIFISSNISNFGAKAFSLYSSSKAGIDGLMRSLAVELAPKIRVNSILPGAINTQMTSDIFQDKEKTKNMLSTYPLGEGYPEDISNIVDFLISEKSKWITGQQFTVDGGRSINLSV